MPTPSDVADGLLVRLPEGLDKRGIGLNHAVSWIILVYQTTKGINITDHQLSIPLLICHIIILKGPGSQTTIAHDSHQF